MRAQACSQGLVAANLGGGNGSKEPLGTAPGIHQPLSGVFWALSWGRINLRKEGLDPGEV